MFKSTKIPLELLEAGVHLFVYLSLYFRWQLPIYVIIPLALVFFLFLLMRLRMGLELIQKISDSQKRKRK